MKKQIQGLFFLFKKFHFKRSNAITFLNTCFFFLELQVVKKKSKILIKTLTQITGKFVYLPWKMMENHIETTENERLKKLRLMILNDHSNLNFSI